MPSTWLLLLTILTVPAVPSRPTPLERAEQVPIRTGPAGVPLVRVEVAPGRPAWFVLDTGASGTTLRTDLAAELGLAPIGATRITTMGSTAAVPVTRLAGLRITGMTATHEVDVAVHDLRVVRQAAPEAEGILGQDVLARHDYLIDLRRGRLVIGSFVPPPDGVRVPLSWSAGRPVFHVPGIRGRHGLVLDSGANVLVMEADASTDALGPARGERRTASLDTHLGRHSVEVERHPALRMADLSLGVVDVVRVPRDAWSMTPEVGLLPAALFSKVYVSARTGSAMVWPK